MNALLLALVVAAAHAGTEEPGRLQRPDGTEGVPWRLHQDSTEGTVWRDARALGDDGEGLPDPWEGVYNECFTTWSLPCIQRKLLVFVDRVGRLKQMDLWGDTLSVVRVGADPGPPISEDALKARLMPGQEDAVGALLQHSFSSFLQSHNLRLRLPSGVTASTGGRALGDTFEVNLGRAFEEARGKKKKQMMMMGAMMMAKAMMLGKMLMLLIKFKAIKALLMSIVALALAKIQLFKSLKNKGGGGGKETYIVIKGGGGGGHGGGGGGHSSGPPSGGGGWSDAGGGGWSSSGGGGGAGGGGGGWQADSGGGGGGGWSSGGGGGGGSSGGWSSGGGGGAGGGWSGGGGGGGSSGGGWGRNYDASWLAYRAHAPNKSDS